MAGPNKRDERAERRRDKMEGKRQKVKECVATIYVPLDGKRPVGLRDNSDCCEWLVERCSIEDGKFKKIRVSQPDRS